MGMLVKGQWTNDDGKSRGNDGKFDHLPTSFRDVILEDGSSSLRLKPAATIFTVQKLARGLIE